MASPRSRASPRRAATAVRNSGFLLREAASAGNVDALEAQLSGLDGVDVDDAGTVWAPLRLEGAPFLSVRDMGRGRGCLMG